MKMKRLILNSGKSLISKFSLAGLLGLIIQIIGLINPLPNDGIVLGESIKGSVLMNIMLIIGSVMVGLYIIAWLFFHLCKPKFDIKVEGRTFINSVQIEITNTDPVDLSHVQIDIVRFSNNKSLWNDIKPITQVLNNNCFSKGLEKADGKISRKPVFIEIAQASEIDGLTEFFFDIESKYFPLENKIDGSAFQEYEIVLKFSGHFEDEKKSQEIGIYYGKLRHTQISAQGIYARKDDFHWLEFYETSLSKEKKMKKEREKLLGFSLSN